MGGSQDEPPPKEPVVTKGEKAERSAMKERIARKNDLERRREYALRQECREVFDLFDTNANGTLDYKEFETVLKVLGIRGTKEEIKRMIATVDEDGNGCIGFIEFSTMMEPLIQNRDRQKLIAEGFHLFDTRGGKDEHGKPRSFTQIDFHDLRNVADELGEDISDAELKEMLYFLDKQGQKDDGVIEEDDVGFEPTLSKKEFIRILEKTPIF